MKRWRPAAGGILVNLALGSLYAWSLFVIPLEREFGWTRAQTARAFTLAVVAFSLSFIAGGRLQDRRGPRLVAGIGTLLVASGFFLTSYVTSLTGLYLAFGLLVGLGNGFGYAAPTPVASKWFPDARGLVVGLMVSGYGAGAAVMGPLATVLMPAFGWRTTFRVMGGLLALLGAVGTALIRNPPDDVHASRSAADAGPHRPDVTPRHLVRLPVFYRLWLAYGLGTTAGLMVISQLVPFARASGHSVAVATVSLALGAAGNAAGRVVSGWLSDAIGRMATLRVMVGVSALAMPAWYLLRASPAGFFLLVVVVYWCYGAQLSLFASTTADWFGTRHLGLNYALLFTGWGAAGLVGPALGSHAYDVLGSYGPAWYATGALALLSFVALLGVHPPGSTEGGR